MTAVVFDLDGTLVDSAQAIRDIGNALMGELGLALLDTAEARSYIGNGAAVFVERALEARGALDPESFETRVARFQEHYAAAPGDANVPMPGVGAALEQLKADGCALAVCTNKPGAPTREVLAAMGWADVFDTVISGDTLAERKPHPAPLQEAARQLDRDTVIYVGDSEVDAQTAAAARIPFFLYLEGYRKVPAETLTYQTAFSDMAVLPDLIRDAVS